MYSRREFLTKIILLAEMLVMSPVAFANTTDSKIKKDILCTLYRAVNGAPDRNMIKVIELLGGIEKIIGSDDVVVIKPNVQWFNQGAPNLSALKTFTDMIMNRPGGFHGEVVFAENCHRGSSPWLAGGWANNFEWNSDIPEIKNMNELSALLKEKYGDQFSICHWTDVDVGGKRVFSPKEGSGYVYCDGTGGVPLITCDNEAPGKDFRATIMTYPIFSTDKGTIIDFKNGIWEKGSYTGQPLRFINFSALNHHSTYCGATSAIKNYLGISDLSGGADPHNGGMLTEKYYNFHSFPFNEWAPGPRVGMIGAEIGVFLKTIRKADMNITTAEWTGLASRINPPVAHTRAVLACSDPVALDYHATKYILFPNSNIAFHNPDNEGSPVYHYLKQCSQSGGGIFDERHVQVRSYDYQSKNYHTNSELVVKGDKKWGTNLKHLSKYLYMRYMQ